MIDANLLMVGTEPKYNGEIDKLELIRSLNWYSQNKDTKDSLKYSSDYFKKKHKLDITDILKEEIPTFGFVCRLISNGAILPKTNQIWFEQKIESIKNQVKQSLVKKNTPVNSAVATKTVNIQDRITEKVSDIAGELEGIFDEYIKNEFKNIPSPYAVLHTKGAKTAYVNRISDIWKKHRSEFDEVIEGKDEQLNEGYSQYNKTQLKKMIAFCDLVITDCKKISDASIKNKNPRKRKTKTPEQLTSKVVYCQKFDELNLISEKPKDIIGASQVWVYNTKQRKLGCYHASDIDGFSIKRSSIINFSESKSIQKKLRKPHEMLSELMKCGKIALRTLLSDINVVEYPLNGRLNEDIVIVRIIK